jgi:hypothetical protein
MKAFEYVPIMFFVNTSIINSNAINKVVSCVSLLELLGAKSLDDGAVSPPSPLPPNIFY